MVASVFALLSLCLVFSTHGIPIDLKISPPKLDIHPIKPVHEGVNPQLLGGGVEGDMILPKGFNPKSQTRGAAKFGDIKWPNRTIPYEFFTFMEDKDQQIIIDAMNILMYTVGTPKPDTTEREMCVYFRPRELSDTKFLKFQYGEGCSASVGYMENQPSRMFLQPDGCFHHHIIQHELLHVLGFFHEQSRPDRDDYLEIHLENVEPNMQHNFDKYAWGSTAYNQGSPYDYGSIMHYGMTDFSVNGKPTMVPRKPNVEIGQRVKLSPVDIAEVRHFYGCTP